MQSYTIYLYLGTALYVSGGTSTHHQERIQLYLRHLVFVTPLLLSAAFVEELELVWVCCGWRTHAATYCVIIQTQRTQISGRNNNGTKHSGGPPEDGREKRQKHVGVLYLQTRF
jgi:hypothetical protein